MTIKDRAVQLQMKIIIWSIHEKKLDHKFGILHYWKLNTQQSEIHEWYYASVGCWALRK